jgi:hypothetical protein
MTESLELWWRVETLRAYALSFAKGIAAGRIVVGEP